MRKHCYEVTKFFSGLASIRPIRIKDTLLINLIFSWRCHRVTVSTSLTLLMSSWDALGIHLFFSDHFVHVFYGVGPKIYIYQKIFKLVFQGCSSQATAPSLKRSLAAAFKGMKVSFYVEGWSSLIIQHISKFSIFFKAFNLTIMYRTTSWWFKHVNRSMKCQIFVPFMTHEVTISFPQFLYQRYISD